MRDACRALGQVKLLHVDVQCLVLVLQVQLHHLPDLLQLGKRVPRLLSPHPQLVLDVLDQLHLVVQLVLHVVLHNVKFLPCLPNIEVFQDDLKRHVLRLKSTLARLFGVLLNRDLEVDVLETLVQLVPPLGDVAHPLVELDIVLVVEPLRLRLRVDPKLLRLLPQGMAVVAGVASNL